ncbi:MAG: hypothetical protein AAFW67_09000, partial [Cyanobacteria bacterium J06638_38]
MNSRKRKTPPANRTQLKNVALFGSETDATLSVPTAIPLQQIVLPASQPRRYFDSEKLEQLTQSARGRTNRGSKIPCSLTDWV